MISVEFFLSEEFVFHEGSLVMAASALCPRLSAVLPEKRRCWQCLCNNRWKLKINTSSLSRYSPLSIYF